MRGTVSRSYTDYLPSVNAVFGITDDLLLRGAVSRASIRSTFENDRFSVRLSYNYRSDAFGGEHHQRNHLPAHGRWHPDGLL